LADIIRLMLPATFQTPAALVLLCGGLLACFAGYRVFRVVLAIYGFILGVLLASSFMGTEQTLWMILIWIGAGLLGAAILMVAYFAGVALLGSLIAALAADAIWASFSAEPGMVAVILFSIGGALAALALQRYVVIVSTSFGGAQTALVGAAALLGDAGAAQAATRAVFNVYPLNPLPNTYWDVGIALALGLAGVIVQLGVTAKGRK
jgi:hypothetical protein